MPVFDDIKSTLRKYTVGIAGAGGLGSNVAMALTRVGIGRLIIADYDTVTMCNLNRQFYFSDQVSYKKVEALKENLQRIDPEVIIEVHDLKLTSNNILDIFDEVDVMVEAFDTAEMKEVIISQFQTKLPGVPIVVGNGMAGWGNSNLLKVEQLGNLFICGDSISEVSHNEPPMAPRVGICAFMQANTVMNILLSKKFGQKPF